jgi:hypothetical protein
MPRPARKALLKPYYDILKQVQTTGKPITITEGNCLDYGLRPSLSSNVSYFRQVKKAYEKEDPILFRFNFKITQLKEEGLRIEKREGPNLAVRKERLQQKKDSLFLTLRDANPNIFNSFFNLFNEGIVKGHVIFKLPSDRLIELAKNKTLNRSQIDFGDQDGISLRSINDK